MMMRRSATKAFTLLELVVVVVVLGILASLAIPTFSRVIERSKEASAVATLSSVSREVQALAAFEGRPATAQDVRDIGGDLTLAASPGLSASAKVVPAEEDDPAAGELGYLFSDGVLMLALNKDGVVCAVASNARETSSGVCVPDATGPDVMRMLAAQSRGLAVAGVVPSVPVPLGALMAPVLSVRSDVTGTSLTWIGNAASYKVTRSSSAAMTAPVVVTTTTSAGAFDASVVPGTTVYYQVEAVRDLDSRKNEPLVVAVPARVPSAPTSVAASPRTDGFSITWAAPVSTNGSAVSGYDVVVNGVVATSTGAGTTSALVTGRAQGEALDVSVRARNAAGAGPGAGSAVTTATRVNLLTNGDYEQKGAYTQVGSISGYFDAVQSTSTDARSGSYAVKSTTRDPSRVFGLIHTAPFGLEVPAGTPVKAGAWVKGPEGTRVSVSGRTASNRAYDVESLGEAVVTLTGQWQYVETSEWSRPIPTQPGLQVRTMTAGSAGSSILVDDAWVATVTPTKLGANIVTDPGFETMTDLIRLDATTRASATLVSDQVHSGAKALKYDCVFSASDCWAGMGRVTMVPGKTYEWGAWVYYPADTDKMVNVTLSETVLQERAGAWRYGPRAHNVTTAVPTNTWVQVRAVSTIPADWTTSVSAIMVRPTRDQSLVKDGKLTMIVDDFSMRTIEY
jgi:prepilin-type N-terminal cleavage/methylation domain-containing protein